MSFDIGFFLHKIQIGLLKEAIVISDIDFSIGNTYPNAEALMNAVLNYEHTSGKIDTSSSHHHGHPQNPQTDELCNGRRRSKSSTSSKKEFLKTFSTSINQEKVKLCLKPTVYIYILCLI